MASIIIPAHNEEAVIARALSALVAQSTPDDEIIVCANGCTDSTVGIAETFKPRVHVLSIPFASKTQALNLGDSVAQGFPRIYVDADVELATGCLDRLKAVLVSGDCPAAAPEPVMNLQNSSWGVRAYYRIWLSLPYCQLGMIGAGVYALSEAGRARFDDFPDIIADDGFVRALFKEQERCKAIGAQVFVRAPVSLSSLLKIKVRSRVGQMQLAARFPELKHNEAKAYSTGIISVAKNPRLWPAAFLYLSVTLITRFRGRNRLQRLSAFKWEKDWSSRGDDGEKAP
ncbi:MAG: glycosyltransferase family 2 protein [Oleiphilaceae bacterium]|nr:glycosyltransferase family 2 protein [Oleiphilaceae bacterium]